MKLLALLLVGFGLGSNRMFVALIGVVVFFFSRNQNRFSEAVGTDKRGRMGVQFEPSAETPKQPGVGTMPETSIAPWPKAYDVC